MTDNLNDINIFHQVGLSRDFETRSCNHEDHEESRRKTKNLKVTTKLQPGHEEKQKT
jgi:hypothetical protein